MKITSGFPGMYRESRHLDRKNSRFCVRSAQNRLFFRRKRVLGETKKHPPRIARVVRLVSLRRLSNFFDSLKRTSAHAGGGPLSLYCARSSSTPAQSDILEKVRAGKCVCKSSQTK